jgi:hypothetical protein
MRPRRRTRRRRRKEEETGKEEDKEQRKEEESVAMLMNFLPRSHRSCLPVWRPNWRPSAGTWYPPNFKDKLNKPVG